MAADNPMAYIALSVLAILAWVVKVHVAALTKKVEKLEDKLTETSRQVRKTEKMMLRSVTGLLRDALLIAKESGRDHEDVKAAVESADSNLVRLADALRSGKTTPVKTVRPHPERPGTGRRSA